MTKRIQKPESVESDPWRSAKWDELTRGRSFAQSDAPTLALLVYWYQVVDRCMADISSAGGGVSVAYQNDMGDERARPQLATMKQASAEIRALNKQLGIDDTAHDAAPTTDGASVLRLVMDDRARKAKRAAYE